MGLAAQVAMAAVAAQQAAAAATSAALAAPIQAPPSVSTGKRKQVTAPAVTPLVPTQKAAGKQKVTPAPPPALESGRRGALVVVQPKAEYGAGKTYGWSDVVAGGQMLLAGKLKLSNLDEKLPNGALKYKVPRTTMGGWAKDDWEVQAAKGQRGIKNTPHWKVEAEMRGRTGLTAAGVHGFRGHPRLSRVSCVHSGGGSMTSHVSSWVVTQLVTLALWGALAGVCLQPC